MLVPTWLVHTPYIDYPHMQQTIIFPFLSYSTYNTIYMSTVSCKLYWDIASSKSRLPAHKKKIYSKNRRYIHIFDKCNYAEKIVLSSTPCMSYMRFFLSVLPSCISDGARLLSRLPETDKKLFLLFHYLKINLDPTNEHAEDTNAFHAYKSIFINCFKF